MIVTLVNGDPREKGNMDKQLKPFIQELESKGHDVRLFILRELELSNCVGCFSCWVKTPGLCVVPDATDTIRRNIMQSELLIFASPIIMGFTSALMKKVQDKMIPLIHPSIAEINGECHHKLRYPKYPDMALIYQKDEDTDERDVVITRTIYKRFVINMKSKLRFFYGTHQNLEEAAYAIDSH